MKHELNLEHDFPIAEELKVSIPITTDYTWGRGWSSLFTKEDFEREVYQKLRDAGYRISDPELTYSCSTLDSLKVSSRLKLYLHPMEFSGYASQEDIDKIVAILKTCKTVKDVGIPRTEQVYVATDFDYKEMLIRNSKSILRWIRENRLNNPKFEPVMSFIHQYRIPRVGDKSVLGSHNIDWEFVETLEKIADALEV